MFDERVFLELDNLVFAQISPTVENIGMPGSTSIYSPQLVSEVAGQDLDVVGQRPDLVLERLVLDAGTRFGIFAGELEFGTTDRFDEQRVTGQQCLVLDEIGSHTGRVTRRMDRLDGDVADLDGLVWFEAVELELRITRVGGLTEMVGNAVLLGEVPARGDVVGVDVRVEDPLDFVATLGGSTLEGVCCPGDVDEGCLAGAFRTDQVAQTTLARRCNWRSSRSSRPVAIGTTS